MYIFLITVHVIACLVLIVVILFQSGRGGGLSESFSSSPTSTIFGTSTPTFLQRATTTCAIVFLLTSLSMAVLSSRRSRSLMQLDMIKRALPSATQESLPQKGPEPKEGAPLEEENTPLTQKTEPSSE